MPGITMLSGGDAPHRSGTCRLHNARQIHGCEAHSPEACFTHSPAEKRDTGVRIRLDSRRRWTSAKQCSLSWAYQHVSENSLGRLGVLHSLFDRGTVVRCLAGIYVRDKNSYGYKVEG